MPINLSSSLQPLSVGDAPSASLYDIRNLNIPQSGGNVLKSVSSLASLIPGAGTLVSLGGNLLGSVLGSTSQGKAQKRAYEYWLKMQEYNSPKNQLARYREAGINPMYAMGNITAGNATSSAETVAPKTDFSQLGNISADMINEENLAIARKNADTQRMAVEADIPLKKRESLKMESEIDKLQAEILKTKAEEQKILSDENLNNEKIEYQKVANEYYALYGDEDYISRINMQEASAAFQRESKKWLGMHARAARDSAKAALNNSSNMKNLYENLAKESQQRIDNFNVQVDKWVEEGKLTHEQAEYMKKQNEHYEENQKLKWIQAAVGAANALSKMDFVTSPEI